MVVNFNCKERSTCCVSTYTVIYTAVDTQGLAATATRTVIVHPVPNTPSIIGGISYTPSTPFVGADIYLTASVYDPDSSDTLTYEWTVVSNPSGAYVQLSPAGPVTMTGQSGAAQAVVVSDTPGDHIFKLTVDDGTDTTAAYITILIDGGAQCPEREV